MSDIQVSASHNILLPRVTIKFCTQCKWNLRAAYFAQELLQTFSTTLGEISLQPSSGGVFVVDITYSRPEEPATLFNRILWDRKTDVGFPETKELKRRVRDVVEPERNLGHVDRDYPRERAADTEGKVGEEQQQGTKQSADSALPRPRDIVAKIDSLAHGDSAPEPVEGRGTGDRAVPAGRGGKGLHVPKPPGKAEGDNAQEKCEDCA